MTFKELSALEIGVYGQMMGWAYFADVDGAVFGVKNFGDVAAIVFRGSMTMLDFWHDVRAAANPLTHGRLGPVHPGFSEHMDDVWHIVREVTHGQQRVVVGHSLGAARAAVLSGLMTLDGEPPIARVVWGEPLSGFRTLADLIGPIPTWSFRNGLDDNFGEHDPIVDLPVATLVEKYARASKLMPVSAPPRIEVPTLDWHHMPIIGWHDMRLYDSCMSQDEVPGT